MQIQENNISNSKTLKDYIPLVITFFVGLIFLSVYQNTVLYFTGVLDTAVNQSFFILILHHLGYASVCSVLLAFVFNFLENKKSNLGFKTVRYILAVLLIVECLLVTYFISNYEPFGANGIPSSNAGDIQFSVLLPFISITTTLICCHFIYRYTAPLYSVISRMYPFTIILFSLFLATLYSDRKPINENKTQYLLEDIYSYVFEEDSYEGIEEYPLARPYIKQNNLSTYFDLKEEKPHIKLIIVEGLGKEFVDTKGSYNGIMPHLKEMVSESLYWPNFLSNTGEGEAALPSVIGSLPYGEAGFTKIENFVHRHTLYSILKKNGYETSFNYGGNSALNSYDKFLVQEGVDRILDKTVFGKAYKLQEEDAAGNTLGYPDDALFHRYLDEPKPASNKPKLEVFLTLSTKAPYTIPNAGVYERKVEQLLANSTTDKKTNRFIEHNLELFASYSYADDALHSFFAEEKKSKEHDNTIYIITGSHLNRNMPSENAIKRYQVPLLIYSPLLKNGAEIKELASHADIAPSLIALLNNSYSLEVPEVVAWLGKGLMSKKVSHRNKEIPLFRGANKIQDFVYNSYLISDGDITELDLNLNFKDNEIDRDSLVMVKNRFIISKSVNKYVTQKDKIIPSTISLIANDKRAFTKSEMIWLQSIFNGKDFDNAYTTARNLAIDKDWNRALLLSEFIISQIPRHADTEILMGRIYSWQKQYGKSVSILKEVVRKYPEYADGYCALLDTYFWSNTEQNLAPLINQIERLKINDVLLTEKVLRISDLSNSKETPIAKLQMQ